MTNLTADKVLAMSIEKLNKECKFYKQSLEDIVNISSDPNVTAIAQGALDTFKRVELKTVDIESGTEKI